MKKIVLTGGGTAGHVYPNIALLPFLEDFQVHYIGSEHGIERDIITKHPQIKYHHVSTGKFRRSLSISNLTTPFRVMRGVREAKRILHEIKPALVFSKGGYVAYPVVRAAAALKIPVIVHESDLSMGLANKMSARYASTILTTFQATKHKKEVTHTGALIRSEILNGKGIPKFGSNSRNLLVIGGSLGAKRINEIVVNAAPELCKSWNVFHVTGKGKLVEDKNFANYKTQEYTQDIAGAYAWADVVVSRAGSGAVAELMTLGKPTLFIPLSTGRGDQIENADYVFNKNAALVLQEENLSRQSFLESLEKVWDKRETLTQSSLKLKFNGTEHIAKLIRSFM